MRSAIDISIHRTQFPDEVRRTLLESLRRRQVHPKFHYDSVKQAVKWLTVHQAFSPWQTDAACREIYDRGFAEAMGAWPRAGAHVVGLGCGGGTKEARLLGLLKEQGRSVHYSPVDVSSALVITSTLAADDWTEPSRCHPLVCDLAAADDLSEVLKQHAPWEISRLVTFFGMIPNFDPAEILPRLRGVLREGDLLLFSANLAPGTDYALGMKRILPLYDNGPTRDWLMTFLLDLGVETSDGELRFVIEACPSGSGLQRIGAWFVFQRARRIDVGEEPFDFRAGERIQLFFSYRYTPSLVASTLSRHGLKVDQQWITPSEEEGVFLCRTCDD
jgi:L-histidine Nalpha-methyltransferase